ncbi:hypothetical protein L6R50_05035 [Myxococcota bacterium]|nr:hypothetical protein [Myxococcota bacterium]
MRNCLYDSPQGSGIEPGGDPFQTYPGAQWRDDLISPWRDAGASAWTSTHQELYDAVLDCHVASDHAYDVLWDEQYWESCGLVPLIGAVEAARTEPEDVAIPSAQAR